MSERALVFVRKSAWLYEAKDYANAEAAARRALMIAPNLARGREARGLALLYMKRFAEAEQELRRAIAIEPSAAWARYYLGILLRETDRLHEAEREFRAVLDMELPPNLNRAEVAWRLGTLLLSQERYAEGWRYYEARHAGEEQRAYPRWAGENLAGKSILLWPEQGLGDVIQFARYAPLLAKQGAQVTLAVNPPLRDLLATLPDVRVVTAVEPNDRFDYWIPIASIPLFLLAGTVPADVPYLRVDPARLEKWRRRLPEGRRIGLGWKGSAQHPDDAERSIEFEQLRPLWRVSAATFVSLQKGRDETIRAPADQPMLQLGAEIEDLADVAAIVAQLELVISVDTALAHVVGALARPGWVLLSRFHQDWRWLRAGERSPWYPSLRLFRQEKDFKWSRPIEAAAAALGE